MKRKTFCGGAFLAGALVMSSTVLLSATAARAQAKAQESKTVFLHGATVDAAVTGTAEYAKITYTNCSCFWLVGGSGDLAVTVYHGLGVAANVTGENLYGSLPSEGLDKIAYLGGPRYTYALKFMGVKHPSRVFAEALFGGVHAFNSLFPGYTASTPRASALAMQAGLGLDIALHKHWAVRAFEVDYVYSQLPNNASNTQNDLKIAAGIAYHFGK